jgi:hypothetical protein
VTGPVDAYLEELRGALPRRLASRRRILAEAEDHLREAARERGEAEAVAAFGPVETVAGGARALAAARLAALALVVLLAFPILTYPVTENSLPPAPWPADEMPGHLAWKQDAVIALFLVGLGAGAAACAAAAGRRRAVLPAAGVGLAALAAQGLLGAVLSVQWADAVPGTPAWLLLLPAANLVLLAGAGVAAARALQLDRAVSARP